MMMMTMTTTMRKMKMIMMTKKKRTNKKKKKKLKIWDYIQNERQQHLSSGAHAITREKEVRHAVRTWKATSNKQNPHTVLTAFNRYLLG